MSACDVTIGQQHVRYVKRRVSHGYALLGAEPNLAMVVVGYIRFSSIQQEGGQSSANSFLVLLVLPLLLLPAESEMHSKN